MREEPRALQARFVLIERRQNETPNIGSRPKAGPSDSTSLRRAHLSSGKTKGQKFRGWESRLPCTNRTKNGRMNALEPAAGGDTRESQPKPRPHRRRDSAPNLAHGRNSGVARWVGESKIGLVSPFAYGVRVWEEKIPKLITERRKKLVAGGPITENIKTRKEIFKMT